MSSPPLREYPKVFILAGPRSDPLITWVWGDGGVSPSAHHPMDSGINPLHPTLGWGMLGGYPEPWTLQRGIQSLKPQ